MEMERDIEKQTLDGKCVSVKEKEELKMASSFLDDLTSILNPLADSDYVVSLLLDEPFESQLSEENAGVSDTQECSLDFTTTSITSSSVPPQFPTTALTFAGNGNSPYSTICGPALIESLPSTSAVQLSYTTDNSIVPNRNPSLLNAQQLERGAAGLPHATMAVSSGPATTIPGLSIYQQQQKMVQRQQQQPIDIGPTQVFGQQQESVINSAGSGIIQGCIQVVDLNKMRPQNMEAANNPHGPGITLQALKEKISAEKISGHLLVETQTGQYQLLRVGPEPVANTTTAESKVVPPPQNVTNVDLQQRQMPDTTIPVVALNQNAKAGNRLQVPDSTTKRVVTATAAPPVSRKVVTAGTLIPPKLSAATSTSDFIKMTPDMAKVKCKIFLSTLLRLANEEPESVATNVKMLVQSLVDAKLEPEEFMTKIQQVLQYSPHPNLIPFLKYSIPHLRYSLATRKMHIDGIRAPALSTVSN